MRKAWAAAVYHRPSGMEERTDKYNTATENVTVGEVGYL